MGWLIAMTVTIGFKLHFTASPGIHSLYDRCYQMMWQLPGVPDNSDDDTVMEMQCTEALYSTGRSLIYAIRTGDEVAEQDVVRRMIQIAMPWTIKRWVESKLVNGKPLVQILNDNAPIIVPQSTDVEEAKLKTLVERSTSWGASGVWRVHRWQLT